MRYSGEILSNTNDLPAPTGAQYIESFLGVLLATAVAITLAAALFGAAASLKDDKNSLGELGVGLFLAWWIYHDLRHLIWLWLWAALREQTHPLALYVASRFHRFSCGPS
jgi:hypothetical protein